MRGNRFAPRTFTSPTHVARDHQPSKGLESSVRKIGHLLRPGISDFTRQARFAAKFEICFQCVVLSITAICDGRNHLGIG